MTLFNIPFIYYLDIFGTIIFAITGVLAASEKRLDLFGVIVVGMVTAIGGGTIRDLVLGRTPVFWVVETLYIWVIVGTTLATFIAARFRPFLHRTLQVSDAIGLGVFTVIGAQVALNLNHPPVIAVMMGVMTGVFGGVVRDVLTDEIPMIFKKEIYATAAMAGAVVFVNMRWYLPPGTDALSAIVTMLFVIGLRLAAIYWNLQLPVFLLSYKTAEEQKKGKNL
ncbi:trimeric intracellular cation channel family protein [Oceanospirillum maris]|uniref:trimeric intracellular cation channel family protein n=1 Tax=Oceanospirillum maris TaxID=64977 RepID=UPI00042569B2|nr:trimeric intracellular cation channel family protein [Oceanospirillum maris]